MLLLYSRTITPRLQYITNFIGKGIGGIPINLTSDLEEFRNCKDPKINYSPEEICQDEFRVANAELLFEQIIRPQSVQCFEANGYKAFFKTAGAGFLFDIFAACFYLLSRYEEYLPHQKDMYGRYAHENSLAFNENFLQLPLINIWLEDFGKILRLKFPTLKKQSSSFTFLPTYDIDIAFSYKHKGLGRNIGGFFKSIIRSQGGSLTERMNVIKGKQADPFDAFGWLDELHKKFRLTPYYFFHVASSTGKYDKNISPYNKHMQELIRRHAERYTIGVHPSWQSGDRPSLLKEEIQVLKNISQKEITISRQHFIRLTLPGTYRQLIEAGIESDFSMGYGSINGFRASVASPFYWYDLKRENQTSLLLYPFCFMDANSFFEQKISSNEALEELRMYYSMIKSINGMMITIWHNSFLGTDKMFSGWKETYESFISGLSMPEEPAAGVPGIL